jgi:hypothetical protein
MNRRKPSRHLKTATRRRRWTTRNVADVFHMTYPLVVLAAIILLSGLKGFSLLLPHPAAVSACIPEPVTVPGRSIGLAPGNPWRTRVISFTAATGTRPGILEYYHQFGEPFQQSRACRETHMGAVPLIQLLPRGYSLASIASGRYDRDLNTYAEAIASFHDPVIISFAHEMNAVWWPWGYGYDTPAVFKAAWRHIVDIFRYDGARNVIWLWDVNKDALPGQATITPPHMWWPGSRYVTWVGIDGYFNDQQDTFSNVFGPTLRSLAAFTSKPVLIAETATAPGPDQAAQIRSLFAGVREHGLAGFVWFDIDSREAWHIEGRPDADTAFRAAAATYQPFTRNQRGITNGP